MTHRRARHLLLPLAAWALALGTAPAPAIAAPADPAPLLLRLPDLGPGYVVEELGFSAVNRACARFRFPVRQTPRVLNRQLGRFPNRACTLWFTRAWTPPGMLPGPEDVTSTAFTFEGLEGARAAIAHARGLAAVLLGGRPRYLPRAEPAPTIGDEAVQVRIHGRSHRQVYAMSLVVWRSGPVVGMVSASDSGRQGSGSGRLGPTTEATLRLAALQQARIAAPTPLHAPVNDDRLVLLDDPGLGAPVMWLGERLPASGHFPALRLRETNHVYDLGENPQPLLRLIYSTPRLPEAAKVELWRARDLRRNLRRPPYPYQCQRRFDIDVPSARAWIDASYLREHLRASGRCPHHGAFITAVALYDDVAVTIDASGCCRSVLPPYDSRAGLRTLLRALRPRPPSAP